MTKPFHIVFALYPDFTQLDFTGPHQVFCRMPGARLTVASVEGGSLTVDGLTFAGLARLDEIPGCDLLCVPGGFGTAQAVGDAALLAQIRRLAGGATWITSVCTGSLVLGAAGLLRGKRAACHWAWRDLLPLLGAVPDDGRVVRDGNLVTGGGVTAGIDFALTIAAEIAGPAVAQALQLNLEYAPAPPFDAGRPERAPASIVAQVQARLDQRAPARRAAVEAAAAKLQR